MGLPRRAPQPGPPTQDSFSLHSSLLLTTKMKWFIDTVPPFELQYIDFLFFLLFFFLSLSPFIQKPVVVINSCTGLLHTLVSSGEVRLSAPLPAPLCTVPRGGGLEENKAPTQAEPSLEAQPWGAPSPSCSAALRMLHRAVGAAPQGGHTAHRAAGWGCAVLWLSPTPLQTVPLLQS